MSTGATSNLGLNQWQLTDPFLMEEMNEDNRKIDAAVTRKKLFDVTTASALTSIDLDLSQIDLDEYLCLLLYLKTGTHMQYYMRVNNITAAYYQYYYGNGNSQGAKTGMNLYSGLSIIDAVRGNGCFSISPLSLTISHAAARLDNSYISGRITCLNLYCDSNGSYLCCGNAASFPAGTQITIYGVKK